MRILGVEATCDETSAAVLEDGKILSSVIFSQAFLHRPYSGVVPELASRAHMEKIASVIENALRKSKIPA
ncbi:MAG: tRNA (adenosine(37)-N6)-threonylcarbamoyltransferase complex transferase subunit TsaD, partial [bacterium]